MVKVGERIVVQGSEFPAYVEEIIPDPLTGRILINLDWKEFGKSHVYLHDEGKVWVRFNSIN